LPVTWVDVEKHFVESSVKANPVIKLAAAGLNPTFPVIVGVVEIVAVGV
jgi:hypothetical protein